MVSSRIDKSKPRMLNDPLLSNEKNTPVSSRLVLPVLVGFDRFAFLSSGYCTFTEPTTTSDERSRVFMALDSTGPISETQCCTASRAVRRKKRLLFSRHAWVYQP